MQYLEAIHSIKEIVGNNRIALPETLGLYAFRWIGEPNVGCAAVVQCGYKDF